MEKEMLIRLVTGAQKGDGGAMDQLFAAFYNDVYYFALKTVKDSDIACDITQETFLEIINTIGNLKEPTAFVTWMKQITYHQCTRYFRKKKEVLVEEDEDGNTIFDTLADESEGSIPSEVYEKEEFRNTILGIINELTEQQRSAVMMYYFDELTVGQIAGIQGVSEGTVKSRLNYARKAIKKSVEDYEKKHNVKLYSFSILPLLALFFGKAYMPADQAAKVQTTVSQAARVQAAAYQAAQPSVSQQAQSTANTAAAQGTAGAAGAKAVPLAVKIVAGITAAALALGGGTALLRSSDSDQPQTPVWEETGMLQESEAWEDPEETEDWEADYEEDLPEEDPEPIHNQISSHKTLWFGDLKTLTFTKKPVPEGVETQDLSLTDDGSILAWYEEDPEQPEVCHGYITAVDGGTLYAPQYCSQLLNSMKNLVSVHFDNLDTSKTLDMRSFFSGCESLENVDLSGLDTSKVRDMSNMFWQCYSLQRLDLSCLDTSNVRDMSGMFAECSALQEVNLSGWDTSRVTNMSAMFLECTALTELDITGFDTSAVTDMTQMFRECEALQSLDVTGFDTSNVTTMLELFYCCEALGELDVTGFDTSSVTDMCYMFGRCKELTTINVTGFDTSSVVDMCGMFMTCENLKYVDVSHFNTSNVTDMYGMFAECFVLESLDVSRWDTSNVVDMGAMFAYCRQLKSLNVSGWNTSKVEDMFHIFYDTNIPGLDLSGWVIPEGEKLGLE